MASTTSPTTSDFADLRAVLAARSGTQPGDWFPVFKARYGMQVVFDALRAVRGEGSVLTQLFTCCTAVDPILVSGLKPRYADISADTLAIDERGASEMFVRLGVGDVQSRAYIAGLGTGHKDGCADGGKADESASDLDESLKYANDAKHDGKSEPTSDSGGSVESIHAVMLQHTFGLIDDASSRKLAEFTHNHGALLVEDSAHCVTRLACDTDGTPLADISIHSFGVEKMLPTRFGGAIWLNPELKTSDPKLDAEIRRRFAALAEPSKHLDKVTRIYINENRVLSRLGGLGGKLRTKLTNAGWYEPPISAKEQQGGLEYQPMTLTPWIAERAVDGINALDANEAARRAVVDKYREAFANVEGLRIPQTVLESDPAPLLRFPLFARDTQSAERIIAAARQAGGYAERWYRPELFPGATDTAVYGVGSLDRSTVPVTNRAVSTCLCLPTELGDETVEHVIAAVLKAI
ncbi:DegT/DnrJ/EryC1/StrS family aminotransferase [Bifidobacterium sp. ESL0745]|uniref:DegT/DnrJ/EryC1/StrS family aminotransferase n=1 Tax=Bifidobacterium sp. ESL0745 TaxID=2983226 RepID=UPI0023F812D5|nr:DegT/DnrJ/EryC1/StrS family aminotransferase [Bifidobacterium sp. ESL0745]MDF7664728.1 DegT/DnrJ/EryC1/StrS family aminotransferase [Bifidobacterium sp. ESL0745]